MSQRRLFSRATVGLAALAIAASSCTNAGGPSFVTLGVDATPVTLDLTGPNPGSPSTENDTELCVRLPVLLGSSTEKEASIAGGLGVKIAATRDGADVTFPGADNRDGARSYSLAELRHGVLDSVDVSSGGQVFEASIVSNCTNP
jgi:hypothetical protein